MSGLLLGILLARTVAGALAALGGWRTIYWVASALMFIMALVLWRCLPRYKQHTGLNYGQLLGSIFALFIHTPYCVPALYSGHYHSPISVCYGHQWPSCWPRHHSVTLKPLLGYLV